MKLITFLCCAVTIIGLAQGLQCYSCYITGCSDPFRANATGVRIATCIPGYNYCGKQSVTIDSDTVVVRDCAGTTNTMTILNSSTIRYDVTYGKIYSCTTDLCNGANSVTSGIAITLVSLAGLAYIIF